MTEPAPGESPASADPKAAPGSGDGYRWPILGLVWLCVLAFAILYQSIPPILGLLVSALQISYAQAGGLMGLYSLPRIFLSIPGGALSDRFGSKRTGRAGLLFLVLGGLVTVSTSLYGVIAVGRMLSGLGNVVLNVVLPKILTSWFRGREIGLAMGVFNTAVPLGFILSLNFYGRVGQRFGWRSPIEISVLVSAVALLFYVKMYRSRDGGSPRAAPAASFLGQLRGAGMGIWWVGISWAFFNGALMSFLTYAPDYFASRGLDISQAGRWASHPMWASLVLSPVAGLLIDRVQRKNLLLLAGPAGMACLLLVIPRFPAAASVLTLVMGVFIALFPPFVFSLPAELLPGSLMGLGFGIISTLSGFGAFLGPYLAGRLRDATGNYGWSFLAIAGLAILSALCVLPLWPYLGRRRAPSS